MALLSREHSNRLRVQLLILVGTILLVYSLDQTGWTTRLENTIFDGRLTEQRKDVRLPEQVKVVLIDESSLAYMADSLGQFPWPRTVYAELIEFFEMGGARVVLFDILFSEPVKDAGAVDGQLSPHDQRLIAQTAAFGGTVHAALLNKISADVAVDSLDHALPEGFNDQFSLTLTGDPVHDDVNSFVLPIPELTAASPHLGIVGIDPDSDGIYRRIKPLWEYQGAVFPAFALAPAFVGSADRAVASRTNQLGLQGKTIATDDAGKLLVNFYGDYQAYSVARIFQSYNILQSGEFDNLPVDPFDFAGAVVFIGASAIGLDDIKAFSNDPKAPGVYAHAAAYANILSGDVLTPIRHRVTLAWVIGMALLAIIIAFNVPKFTLKIAILLSIPLLWWWWTGYSLAHNVVTNFSLPMASLLLSWGWSFTYLSFTEGASKRRVKRMLSQYVSEEMMNEVLAQSDDILHAGVGRTETLSILFCDVRGFTNLSETLPAEDVVQLLNCHFSAMSDVIFHHQGTLDKFIGDAIMAFWGAPIAVANHADLSVSAALEMISQLQLVNHQLTKLALPSISVGIGINTGEVILGNIGSDRKLDYTVIGDAVNVASRLEGITKTYGVPIVISDATRRALSPGRPCVLLDRVRVKGKTQPSAIYYPLLLDDQDEASAVAAQAMVGLAERAFECYQQQQWDDAVELYKQLPLQSLQTLFLARINEFRLQAPSIDWDGTYTLTTK